MKVRHRPTLVDAVRWLDDDASRRELADLGYRADCGDFRYEGEHRSRRTLVIPTDNGHRRALPGDYVMRGTQGEWYPIAVSVFEANYDPVVAS